MTTKSFNLAAALFAALFAASAANAQMDGAELAPQFRWKPVPAPRADITSNGTVNNILTNCLVKSVSGRTQDSYVMTGNPKFVDAANGDYHLSATSPCREKGLVLDWMTAGATDLDGNPRLANLLGLVVADARPDLGCYECQEKGLVPTVMSFR